MQRRQPGGSQARRNKDRCYPCRAWAETRVKSVASVILASLVLAAASGDADWDVVLDVEASRERTYCGATAEYREEPELQFDPPIPACPGGGWRDWHNVAVLAADPAVDFQALQERLRDSVELLGTDILPDRSTSPQLDALRLKPGKALLLSKVGEDGDQNEDELFSLLARTSNSDVIVLVRAGQEEEITQRFIDDGGRSFRGDARIGLLQARSGHLEKPFGKFPIQLVPLVDFSKPIMLRRKLFLEMGGLQCLEERCFSAGVMQLSESMWRHGFYVGVVDTGNSQPDEVKGISLAVPPLCPNPPSKKRFDEIRKHIKAIRSAKQEQPKKAMSDRYGKHSLCLVPDRGSNEITCGEPLYTVAIAVYSKDNQDFAENFSRSHSACFLNSGMDMEEIQFLVSDDSTGGHGQWINGLRKFPNARLMLTSGLGIVRAYNKLAKLSSAKYIAFVQDDSLPRSKFSWEWLQQGVWLLDSRPGMQVLSGGKGQLEFGLILNKATNQVSPTEYGCTHDSECGLQSQIQTHEPDQRIPLMYVYKASSTGGPLFVRKETFVSHGMFRTETSCQDGEDDEYHARNGFAHEFSIRIWNSGSDVGLYAANWSSISGDVQDATSLGNDTDARLRRLQRNALLYELYPTTHHMKGTQMAIMSTLGLGKGWRVWVPILNGDTLRSGHVNTNESRMKSAHALATLNLAFKVVRDLETCVSMGYANEVAELGLCCVDPMTGKCWTKMLKSPECKQGVEHAAAYCGSGYAKRRKYVVHGEWEWRNFQAFLNGSKLRNDRNDYFRNLVIPQHIEDLRAQLGIDKINHMAALDWLNSKRPSGIVQSNQGARVGGNHPLIVRHYKAGVRLSKRNAMS